MKSVTRERDGLTYHYAYDSGGRLVSSTDFDGNTTRYEYNQEQVGTPAHELLSSITDPLDRKISYTYYDDGRAFEQTEPGDGHWSFFYSADNDNGKYVSVQGIDGNSVEFRLDENGLIKEIIHPDRTKSRYSLQWNGSVAETDELGAKTTSLYDASGNLVSIKKPSGAVTTFNNDPKFGKPLLIRTPAGDYSFTIDPENGDVTRIQSSLTGLALDFEYDSFGNPLSFNNGRGIYSNIRNEDGLLTMVYDSRNPETRTYDSRGRVRTRSFASGRVLTYTWDNHDRMTRLDDTDGPTTLQAWDKVGRITERTITDGTSSQTTKYKWDDRDRLIEITDAMDRTTTIEYDKVAIGCNVIDKPSVITNPEGKKTRFFYDLRQRLTRMVDANGGVTRYDYNARGDLTGVTDPENNRTKFYYDSNRRVIKRERPSAVIALDGSPQAVTEVTTYSWDLSDRLIREERGLAGSDDTLVTEYEWDALSRLTRRVLTRQKWGQIAEVQDDATYTYQPQLDATLLATAANQVASLRFEHEAVPPFASNAFEVTSSDPSNPLGLIEENFRIGRDITGGVSSLASYAGRVPYQAQYDRAGRMTKLISGDYVSGDVLTFTRQYDGFGRPRASIASTGLLGSFSWDALNRQVSGYWNGLDGSGEHLGISQAITYDGLSGNINAITREFGVFQFEHDWLDQLLSVAYNGAMALENAANSSWEFDYAGNRVSQGSLNLTNILVENATHKFVPDPMGTGSLAQKIDRGTGATEDFTYRADQKLTSYSKDGLVAEYFYDALGRRVAKKITKGSEPAFTQSYMHLGDEDKILLGKSGDGEITVYLDGQGIDEHLGEVSSRGARAYATDHLGSVLNGEAAGAARAFGAWGENLNATAPEVTASSAPVAYGYTGRQLDPESQTYYYRARNYLHDVGRFAQADPIGFDGGDTNLYRYVFGNPLKYTDPTGTVVPGIIAIAIGIGILMPPDSTPIIAPPTPQWYPPMVIPPIPSPQYVPPPRGVDPLPRPKGCGTV